MKTFARTVTNYNDSDTNIIKMIFVLQECADFGGALLSRISCDFILDGTSSCGIVY